MGESAKNIFVFVVCGNRMHIDTLHFSLHALKHFSKNEIIVVTDAARNEIPVQHSGIIDIKTPEHLNHHQASIYLKTGLHKFLPAENNYCYLDTDVVALCNSVDEIFSHFASPVTFCTDHCRINTFSPSAVNCNCPQLFEKDNETLKHYLKEFDEQVLPQINYIDKCIREINEAVAHTKKMKWKYALRTLSYYLPSTYYRLNSAYKLNKKTGYWYDANNTLLWYAHKDNIRYTEEKTGFHFNRDTKEWFRGNGESLGILTCNHLIEFIHKKFAVAITPPNWQHWNGGVFLFNNSSREFMEKWHTNTMNIFTDSNWKTRDQGTLAATVWHYNLQKHKTLPVEFNFIADYNRSSVKYKGKLSFCLDESPEPVHPYFIHIYHHWGDEQWKVWRDVKEHILATHA